MDFAPTEAQTAWQAKARTACVEVIGPAAAAVDRAAEFPTASFARLREDGFLALAVPAAYGGCFVDYVSYVLVMEEIATACASTACCLAMHFGCVAHVVARGDEALRRELLTPVVESGRRGPFGPMFAVATADSSVEAGKPGIVTAAPSDDGYVLDGAKHFVSSAGHADYYVVQAAMPGLAAPALFVVDGDAAGLSVDRSRCGVGLRGSATYDLNFDAVKVPLRHRLGEIARPCPMNPTASFSLGLAATVWGAGHAALLCLRDDLRKLQTAQRGSFGPTATLGFEKKQHLGEMATIVESARWLLRHAAWQTDRAPESCLPHVLTARYVCAESGVAATQKSMRALGGRAYLDHYPVERFVRDALAGPLQAACHVTCPQRLATDLLAASD